MKNIHAVSLALVLAACSPTGAAVQVDKAAPGFSLPDSSGKQRSLSDFKGKTVVLEWHNKDCPYVVKHYGSGNMQKRQKEALKKGVVWLTIISSAKGKQGYVTGPQAESDMKKAGASPSHILLDPEGTVGKLYGAKTTPHMYVIDGEGVLRYNGAIDSISSADASDIAKAENYVASALDAVLAGGKVATPSTRPYGCSVKYAK
jgi:peroxiredoxin